MNLKFILIFAEKSHLCLRIYETFNAYFHQIVGYITSSIFKEKSGQGLEKNCRISAMRDEITIINEDGHSQLNTNFQKEEIKEE